MFQIPVEIIKLKPEVLFYIWDFPITSTFTTNILTTLTVVILCFWASSFSVLKPSKLQLWIEMLVTGLIDFVSQLSESREVAKKIVPIVLSLVGFILISNLILSLIPFAGAITYQGKGLFRASTSDVNFTLPLAFCVVSLSQMLFIKRKNILGYLFKFLPLDVVLHKFRKGLLSGFSSIIDIFIGFLDIIGEFAKIVSLSLRLFGNMFAGELLLKVFMSLFAIFLPVPIILLGSLSGLIQAVVFGALAASYLKSSIQSEDN
ncbi:F0F1 ATP synthase subunit A [Candidatus Dojkabacteria bacterium]|uniref:ATP synthase subunit a n=1 Tax=Candidatus Dojkabacteria bacterium TaxID=2099670 RepID=A0A3M0YZE2_9BACT|nr:MAG: F0F1 ATP synthase subunit A [Candidatus Dojkabacteria bacterium]